MVNDRLGKLAKKYYNFTFKLPKFSYIAILLAIAYITLLALLIEVTNPATIGPTLLVLHLYYLTIVIFMSLAKPMRNKRRLSGSILVVTLTNIAAFLLTLVLRNFFEPNLNIASKATTIMALSLLPLTLLLYGLKGLLYALAYIITIYSITLALSNTPSLYLTATAVLLALYVSTLEALFGKEVAIGRAFIYAIMDDDYSLMEYMGGREERDITIKIHLVKLAENECIAIIAPRLHYGPFRRAGSSELPYMVKNMLNRKGIAALVLHADVTHHYNLASRQEAIRIANLIAEEVKKECNEVTKGTNIAPKLVTWVDTCNSFRCTWIASAIPIVIIDRPGKGIDDFTLELNLASIIDAHNEEEKISITSSELKALYLHLKEKIRDYAHKPLERCNAPTHIGFHEEKLNDNVAKSLGLCENWIQALVLNDSCGQELALVVLPSNNALTGIREAVEEELKKIGFEARLITIDDHKCAGMKPKSPSYVLRDDGRGSLRSIVRETVIKAKNRSSDVKTLSYIVINTRVKVWGKFFDYLSIIAESAKRPLLASIMIISWLFISPLIAVFLP